MLFYYVVRVNDGIRAQFLFETVTGARAVAEKAEQLLRENAAAIYAEIAERAFFKHILSELKAIVGERAAANLVFRIVRSSMREAVEEVLPRGMVSNKLDAMMLCYKLFEAAGLPFEVEIEGGSAFRATQCPHYRFTAKNPVACIACAATKAGALEALTGKRVAVRLESGAWFGPRDAGIVVERTSHMPSGDPFCRFVLHENTCEE